MSLEGRAGPLGWLKHFLMLLWGLASAQGQGKLSWLSPSFLFGIRPQEINPCRAKIKTPSFLSRFRGLGMGGAVGQPRRWWDSPKDLRGTCLCGLVRDESQGSNLLGKDSGQPVRGS